MRLVVENIHSLLVTAPSNSAADLVAQRLSEVLGPDALFRLYGRSRKKKDVPENLLRYTLTDGTELDIPPPSGKRPPPNAEVTPK